MLIFPRIDFFCVCILFLTKVNECLCTGNVKFYEILTKSKNINVHNFCRDSLSLELKRKFIQGIREREN